MFDCLIIHGCHHKTGTAWFETILNKIANEFDLKYIKNDQALVDEKTSIFFHDHSYFDFDSLQHFKGSHMIRDPRDVLVSGYYYHLYANEPWLHLPCSELPWISDQLHKDKRSYQEILNSLKREEGMLFELENLGAAIFRDLETWNYKDDRILELKYESVFSNYSRENYMMFFEKIFKFYGAPENHIEKLLSIAWKYSFENISKRKLGVLANRNHTRIGISGQWVYEFSEELKNIFKERFGELLIKLNYESNLNW